VSSLEALDISGVASSNWSQYPTLASSIIFQPAYILSNVSNKLYFAGTEITDLSGGGEDWSRFPALFDVSMNNFSLRGLSTLQYQDGATLVSQTGNNLLYNGQPVQFGAVSNVSQWANYPAVNTIQTGGFPISSLGNLTMTATSNTRLLANSISTVADQGLLNLASYADINLTAQNGLKGRINLTANPGAAGVFGEINLTANGGTVAGVGTGGEINIIANTPLGLSNLTSAVNINAAGINSYAGAIPPIGSVAGYNFVYGTLGTSLVAGIPPSGFQIPGTTYLYGTNGVTTSSEFYVPSIFPYFNGVTTPPDLAIQGRVTNAQQVFVTLSNVKSMAMGGTAAITGANLVSTVSTVGQSASFTSGSFGALASGTLGVTGNVLLNVGSGTTQAASLSTNSISTAVVTAPLLSTININLSTINGVDWQDISGSITTTSTFTSLFAQTMTTSTLNVSSINQIGGTAIKINGFLEFATPDSIGNVVNINVDDSLPMLTLNAQRITLGALYNTETGSLSTTSLQASQLKTNTFLAVDISAQAITTSTFNVSSINQIGGSAIKINGFLEFATPDSIGNVVNINVDDSLPMLTLNAQNITLGALSNTFAGSMSTQRMALGEGTISSLTGRNRVALSSSIDFLGTPFTSRLEQSQCATVSTLCLTEANTSNLVPLTTGGLIVGGNTASGFSGSVLFSTTGSSAVGVTANQIGGNGAFQGTYLRMEETAQVDLIVDIPVLSSIQGVIGNGPGQSTIPPTINFSTIFRGPILSSQELYVSSINGLPPGGGGGSTTNVYSSLFTSSINFSTARYFGSNTGFYYPIIIDQDHAQPVVATAADGAAISVRGHNFQTGAVQNTLEMGVRGNGENYIMAVWPGVDLEDLYIDSTDCIFRNSAGVSTIINQGSFYAVRSATGAVVVPTVSTLSLTTSSIVANVGVFQTVSTQSLLVSSIVGNDARPAFLNALTTSTMELYTASTTLMSLDSNTTSSNINISGYDAVVGVNGTYKIGTSFQFISPGSADEVEFFVLKNNVPISYGGGICSVQNNEEIIQYCEIVEPLVNGDAIQVGCFTNGTNVFVSTVVGTAIISPAMILTMYKVN
jgi:hypothetical protein